MKRPSLFKTLEPKATETATVDGETKANAKPNATDLLQRVKEEFDQVFYLSKNADVALAEVDALEHYLTDGWREKRAPNAWFRPEDYVSSHPELSDWAINPFLHYLQNKDLSKDVLQEELTKLRHNQFLFWAGEYWNGDEGTRPVVVATGLPGQKDLAVVQQKFDAEYYLAQNPDVAEKHVDPLLHFMTIGWIEGRDPNPDFSVSFYLRHNADIRRQRVNPYLHYLNHGHKVHWRKATSVADAEILNLFEENEEIQADISAAKALEPMVALPNTNRKVTSPLTSASKAMEAAEQIRKTLAGKTYRYIVCVPHVRMSGASRVASIFADALSKVADPADILVVTTDSSESEYIGWFSDKLSIFDLSKYIDHLGNEDRIRALIDLMRGVQCKTLINVNSRLVWDGMRIFGRQMHHEFNIATYLFTWDENANGDRVGYPIQWLRDTANHHHLLLTDTQNLAHDVSERLGFGTLEGEAHVVPLYTPIGVGEAKANREVGRNDKPRILWAGRFDAQKRVDLLVAIAKANPTIEFDVYGKVVLDKKGLEDYDPPDNINAMGTYSDLQTVLDVPYAGFLYTAQWDGLPTILLDMASAGLPIVAPNVGGIAELISNETGWLIEDFEDVEGFSEALQEMVRSPETAEIRAKTLQASLETQFSEAGYINNIKTLVTDYDL